MPMSAPRRLLRLTRPALYPHRCQLLGAHVADVRYSVPLGPMDFPVYFLNFPNLII